MEKNYRAELIGLFGDPVDGNPIGVVEEAAFAARGLNYRYIITRVPPDDLEAAFRGIQAMGFRGANLTMPHKIQILPLLDEIGVSASIIGAVNTVVCRDGRWIGENSDGKGFVAALLKNGGTLEGKHVTLLGAGGAARAIGVECALAGAAKISVINRNAQRGAELAALIADKTPAQAEYLPWTPAVAIPAGTQILINATCVGFGADADKAPDICYDTVTPGMYVSDVVFNPTDPLFLQKARARGAKTLNGVGMMVQQGAINFTIWTGEEAPVDVRYEALAPELG